MDQDPWGDEQPLVDDVPQTAPAEPLTPACIGWMNDHKVLLGETDAESVTLP